MRYTWHEIQQTYPDQWVYMKDMAYIHGDLISAVVIYNCKAREDIYKFAEENPDKLPNVASARYTGNPIDFEVLSEDEMFVSLAEPGGVI